MPFQPGQSGNPNGRPKKERALTYRLEKELLRPGRRAAFTRLIVEAVTTGKVQFPDELKPATLSIRDWIDLTKFIFSHLDGPAKQELGLDASGEIKVLLDYANDPYSLRPSSPGSNAGDTEPQET